MGVGCSACYVCENIWYCDTKPEYTNLEREFYYLISSLSNISIAWLTIFNPEFTVKWVLLAHAPVMSCIWTGCSLGFRSLWLLRRAYFNSCQYVCSLKTNQRAHSFTFFNFAVALLLRKCPFSELKLRWAMIKMRKSCSSCFRWVHLNVKRAGSNGLALPGSRKSIVVNGINRW